MQGKEECAAFTPARAEAEGGQAPLLGLVMIVKNENATLATTLASIKGERSARAALALHAHMRHGATPNHLFNSLIPPPIRDCARTHAIQAMFGSAARRLLQIPAVPTLIG